MSLDERSPHSASAATLLARHYIRDLVYGANDGLITTFAVVAGVTGGALSHTAVLMIGAANLVADGLSMAVGNFVAIRANEAARRANHQTGLDSHPVRHAVATYVAFVVAGVVPLVPYLLPAFWPGPFTSSTILTLGAMFGVGATRGLVTLDPWWKAGLEMLALGVIVAIAAYAAAAVVGAVLQ